GVPVVKTIKALVVVHVTADLAVTAFHPLGHVVAKRVVPADADILVAGIDLERGCTAGTGHQGDGNGQRAHPVSCESPSPVFHYVLSLPCRSVLGGCPGYLLQWSGLSGSRRALTPSCRGGSRSWGG